MKKKVTKDTSTSGTKKKKKTQIKAVTETQKEYNKYVRSPQWRSTRETILQHRGYRCLFCGRTPEDGIKLTVHHSPQAYYYLGHELEHEDLLLVICDRCHLKAHKGKDNFTLFTKKDEIWKDVKGLTKYEISDFANLRDKESKTIVPIFQKDGYTQANVINDNNKEITVFIHQLVADTFLPDDDELTEIYHKDGCTMHNWAKNLKKINKI